MSNQPPSRFTSQNKTTNERLSTTTVGLVALSDFRKRRAEVLEAQEREAREAILSNKSTPDRSLTGTPDNTGSDTGGEARQLAKKKKKAKIGATKLSFGDDEDGENDSDSVSLGASKFNGKKTKEMNSGSEGDSTAEKSHKIVANSAVGMVPKVLTKAALRREAAEREALRREFLAIQEVVKATEIAIPFVFYDGTNTPGGTVRIKKGEYIWVFLDKSRKVGAELGVGERANARKEWARIGVDDLMLVRETMIIPPVSSKNTRYPIHPGVF
jgi:protein FAM50